VKISIPLFKVHMPAGARRGAGRDASASGYIAHGSKVEEFEAKLAAYTGNSARVRAERDIECADPGVCDLAACAAGRGDRLAAGVPLHQHAYRQEKYVSFSAKGQADLRISS